MWIYEIRNLVTDKVYIGQTIQKNPNMRWKRHRQQLQKNLHVNSKLQNSWNKHGKDVWKFTVLATADTLDELNKLEEQYVRQTNCISKGYNILPGGTNTYRTIKKGRPQAELYQRETPYPALIDPNGMVHDNIRNLMQFCRNHDISLRHVRDIYTGKRKSTKGWKLLQI